MTAIASELEVARQTAYNWIMRENLDPQAFRKLPVLPAGSAAVGGLAPAGVAAVDRVVGMGEALAARAQVKAWEVSERIGERLVRLAPDISAFGVTAGTFWEYRRTELERGEPVWADTGAGHWLAVPLRAGAELVGVFATQPRFWIQQFRHELYDLAQAVDVCRKASSAPLPEAAPAAEIPLRVALKPGRFNPKAEVAVIDLRPEDMGRTRTVHLSDDLWKWARIVAVERNLSASDVVAEALQRMREAS
jgi:hypothetical protein